MCLAALVLILSVLAVSQASTKKLHADGPPSGEAASGPSIAMGEHAELDFQDPARVLIDSIIGRDFQSRGDVIMERLRPDFERIAGDLEQLDLTQIRAPRRGKDWVILTAPVRSPQEDPADEPSERTAPPAVYQLRLVCQENVWKLDRMKKLEANES
jgi:hypothetical protein